MTPWLALLLAAVALGNELVFPLPTPEALASAPSFAAHERLVATHYFYWYRFPDEHMEELALHFPEPQRVSYESVAWHEQELADMEAAGIDVVLPVYWGAPGSYAKRDLAFSVRGLAALCAALDARVQAGGHPPRVGLFYDTSTLSNAVRGVAPADGRADLRTDAGRELFYGTLRDFFCQVPPRHWAQREGRPIVVLYSASFAAGYDQGAFDELARRFAADFGGRRPFVVRDESWAGVSTDAVCAWGAALDGAHVRAGSVQIGPGYDDSAVRGRRTPIREREDGRFYEQSWRAALRADAELVLVETWNEHHEGTSIAVTREHGRRYVELTARYAELFRAGRVVAGEIELEHALPRPRADRSWGEDSAGAEWVSFEPGGAHGLRAVLHEDGRFDEIARADGARALRTSGGVGGASYLYLQVADAWAFDAHACFELVLEHAGADARVEYDGHDERAPLHGAYTSAGALASDAPLWRTSRVHLHAARLANRQNAGADLRLCVAGSELELARASLRASACPDAR